MATELGASREAYLGAVCRWSTPNPIVQAMLDAVEPIVSEHLHPLVGDAQALKAAVFRKSQWAALGTHGHQDAGYWVTPQSTTYDLTTWIALDDITEANGALRVMSGSHRGPVEPPVDYLAPAFKDPAIGWASRAKTVALAAGDMLVFGPRLWHASHDCAPDRLRRALVIRWRLPGSTAGGRTSPPQTATFGMFTAGDFLRRALEQLAGETSPTTVTARIQWALETDLVGRLPKPAEARRALERLLLYHRAWNAHVSSEQRGMVWEAVRDLVIAPVIGLDGSNAHQGQRF